MRRFFLLPLALAMALGASAYGGVIYVNTNAQGANTGANWDDAFTSLQAALTLASAGHEIWVADGTYRPSEVGQPDAHFAMKAGVDLYGGFAGGEVSRDLRDPGTNRTILSGDYANNDAGSVEGNEATRAENAKLLVIGAVAILDGFEIADAQGVNSIFGQVGGLLFTPASTSDTLTVRNCVFRNNYSGQLSRAALASINGTLIVEGCDFIGNVSGDAAGILVDGGTATIRNSRFIDNTAFVSGSAIGANSANLTVVRCEFQGNICLLEGGGAINAQDTPATIASSTFIGNDALQGGAIFASGPEALNIVNSVFAGNSADWGGAVYLPGEFGPNASISNCSFGNNSANNAGGAVSGASSGGRVAEFANCILWSNRAAVGPSIDPSFASAHAEFSYSIVAGTGGGWNVLQFGGDAGGNLDADPRFANSANNELQLTSGSAAIDAGNNSRVAGDFDDDDGDSDTSEPLPKDVSGADRFFEDPAVADTGIGPAPIVDMGAFEHQPSGITPGIRIVYIDTDLDHITLKNFGNTTTDVRDYRLCSVLNCTQGGLIDDFSLVSGDWELGPGDTVTFRTWDLLEPGSDVALFKAVGDINESTTMVDFVQWVSGGNGHESVAVAKGIWGSGDRVVDGSPYTYHGNGVQFGVASWSGTDVNGPPIAQDQAFSVPETAAAGSIIGTVQASDPDGPAIAFAITAGNGQHAFRINSQQGHITVVDNSGFESTQLYLLTVEVRDTHPSDPETTVITVAIHITEVNRPPEITSTFPDVVINEHTQLDLIATATDPDIPANRIRYGLDLRAIALGAEIDQLTGDFSWTPAEVYGPGTFTITIIAMDNGFPAMMDQETFTVTVNEINSAPVLNPIGNREVTEGQLLTFTAAAVDTDFPLNTVTYTLGNAPPGASINPGTGVFNWTPTPAQGPGAYNISVIATDNGAGNLRSHELVNVLVHGSMFNGSERVVWQHLHNVVLDGDDLVRSQPVNEGELEDGWLAGAIGAIGIPGDNAFVETIVDETDSSRVIGLSDRHDTNQRNTDILWGIHLRDDGKLDVLESGVSRILPQIRPAYESGDALRVEIIGQAIFYKRNGIAFYVSQQTVSDSQYPIHVDTSLLTNGATLRQVTRNPIVPVSPKIIAFAASDPDQSDNFYSRGDTLLITFDRDSNRPGGTGVLTRLTIDSLFQFNHHIGDNYFGRWVARDMFLITIDDTSDHRVIVGELTVSPRVAGTPIQDITGTSAPSIRVSPTLTGDFGTSLAGTDPVWWQNLIRATDSGGTNNLAELPGNDNNFASAVSVQTFEYGDVFVQFVVQQTAHEQLVGFTSIPNNASALHSDIRFGAMLKPNGVFGVSETPHLTFDQNFGTYKVGDIIKVAITSRRVTYSVNDEVRYVSNVTVTPQMYPMAIDTFIGAGSIGNVRFSRGSDAVQAAPVLVSATASDPDDLDRYFSLGDTITLELSRPTNLPGVGTLSKAEIDSLFGSTEPIAKDYIGSWTAPNIFTITITDVDDTQLLLDETQFYIAGDTEIRNPTEPSGYADPTFGSVTLFGNWGTFVTPGSEVVWENFRNTFDELGGTLAKIAGKHAWDANADSARSFIYGDLFVEMKIQKLGETRYFGLNPVGVWPHPNRIRFGIHLAASNNGFHVASDNFGPLRIGDVRLGDVVRILVEDGKVYFQVNDITRYSPDITLTEADYPLEVAGAIFTQGGRLRNVRISVPPSAFPPKIIGLQVDDPNDKDLVLGSGDTITVTFDKDTAQPGAPLKLNKSQVDDLLTFSENLGNDYQASWHDARTLVITIADVGGNGGTTIGETYVTPTGGIAITDTTVPPSPGSYKVSPTLIGDYGETPGHDVTWQMPFNVAISDNSLAKTADTHFPAGAVSAEEVPRDGFSSFYVEMHAVGANRDRIIGFTDKDEVRNKSDIIFGAYPTQQGLFFVSERGTRLGPFGTYSDGDRIRVEVTSDQAVVYSVNGLARYVSGKTVDVNFDLPYRVGSFLISEGSTVDNARLSVTPSIIRFTQSFGESGFPYTLTIRFNADTNMPGGSGVHSRILVNQLFSFDHSIGQSYSGQWLTPAIYRINVANASGNALTPGTTRVRPAGLLPITDSAATSTSRASDGPSPSLFVNGSEAGRPIIWDIVRHSTINNENTLIKTDVHLWNDAGASSKIDVLFGDAFFQFTVSQIDKAMEIGWTNYHEIQHIRTRIDYGVYIDEHTGALGIRENGALVDGPFGFLQRGDTVRVEFSGGRVLYKLNGVVVRVAPDPVDPASYPYRVNAILGEKDAQFFNVRVSMPPDFRPSIDDFRVYDPDDHDEVYSDGDVFRITFDRRSNRAPQGDGRTYNKDGVDDLFSFTDGTVLGSDYIGRWIGSNIFEITVTDTTGSSGVALGAFAVQPAGDVPILDEAETSGGSSFVGPLLHGEFGLINKVVWLNQTNLEVQQQNLYKDVYENVPNDQHLRPNDWKAGAEGSLWLTTGFGYIETRVTDTTTNRMIGWTNRPAHYFHHHHFTTINFAAYINWYAEFKAWREPGRFVHELGHYEIGDIVRLELDPAGPEVRWLVNGVQRYAYNPGVLEYPYRVRATVETPGGTLTDVVTNLTAPEVPFINAYVWNDNGDNIVNVGDTLDVRFNMDTNMPFWDTPVLEWGDVRNMLIFHDEPGNGYTGRWIDARTFRVNVTDGSETQLQVGRSTVEARGGSPDRFIIIRNAAGTSNFAFNASPPLTKSTRSANGVAESVEAIAESIAISLTEGWNLVAVPISPLDANPAAVFGDITKSPILTVRDGANVEAETIEVGRGYWVFNPGKGTELTLVGIRGDHALDLQPGWQLVGVNGDTAVPDGARAHAFTDGRYVPVQSLQPGKGYWVHYVP